MGPADDKRIGVLTLECVKCTKVRKFAAVTRELAVAEANRRGWRNTDDGRSVCPTCPGGGKH